MEHLNLVTTDELKSGKVFYFENEIDKLEINHSSFTGSYWLYFNGKETPYFNLADLKVKAQSLIKKYELKLTYKK